MRLDNKSLVGLEWEIAMLERPVLVADSADPGLVFPTRALSVVQYLILCTELSKLLEEEKLVNQRHGGKSNVLDVGRIHFHECSVLQEDTCNPLRHLDRELAICIEFFVLRGAPHQRHCSFFQNGKEALFVK